MKTRWSLCLSFVLACFSTPLWAEPYLAAWEGVNCNACHINQTGGYIRNDFGRNYGNNLKTFDWQGIADTAQALTHKTPVWISAGFDFHETYGALFLPNTSGAVTRFNQNEPFVPMGRQSFSIAMKANEAITGVFSYRLDENLPKEAYALISGMPNDAYIKLGKFVVPYGLELSNDNSLVRDDLIGGNIFSFDSPFLDGAEAGIYPGDLFLNAAVFNDSAHPSEADFSARGGFNVREITLGGTIYGQNIDYSTQKMRYGAYGWGHAGPIVLLGEFDSGFDNLAGGRDNYTAYHASAEVDMGGDIFLRLTSEYLNDDALAATYDGFQHIVSVRFYPVRNFKCQIDVERLDPTAGSATYAQGPVYGSSIDTYLFY